MTSLRVVWVLRGEEVLLSRRFPTVENRVHSTTADSIPSDNVFVKAFRQEVAGVEGKGPLLHATKLCGNLWPVVYIKRPRETKTWSKNDGEDQPIYFIAIPEINKEFQEMMGFQFSSETSSSAFLQLPCITATLALLEDIAKFASAYEPSYDPKQMAELQMFLSCIMPFGSPIDTSLTNIKSLRKLGFPSTSNNPTDVKRPAWKPYLYKSKGKQKLEFLIREEIRASQYDDRTIPDYWNVSGTILCKADLEGLPEVTISLTWPEGGGATITHISVDSRVQPADVVTTRKLCFTPPLSRFPLCTYFTAGQQYLPLRGFYQMKEVEEGGRQVKILAQLKLHESVTNSFQYCEMRLPFPNRGKIISTLVSPTAGSITVDEKKKYILWNIGQRFTSRNLEVALPGTITFDGDTSANEGDDPFCIGTNAFVEVRFKALDSTLSGMDIEGGSGGPAIYPQTKAAVTVRKEVVGKNYVIWNSLGQKRFAITS